MSLEATAIKKSTKEESQIYKRRALQLEPLINIGLDAGAMLLAAYVAIVTGKLLNLELLSLSRMVLPVLIFVSAGIVIAKGAGLYGFKLGTSSTEELPKIALTLSACSMFTILSILVIEGNTHYAGFVSILWPAAIVLVYLSRVIRRTFTGWQRLRGVGLRNVLIVGAGQVGNDIAKKLKNNTYLGFNPIGFVDSNPLPLGNEKRELTILGKEDELENLINKYKIHHVIMSFSASTHDVSLSTIRQCQNIGVTFSVIPRLFEALSGFDTIDNVQSIPLVTLQNSKQASWKLAVKRLIDILGSVCILILSTPFLITIGIIIKLDSKGPVFFKQKRCGKNGKRFSMLKFRSMIIDAESKQEELLKKNEASGLVFKMKDDPRITKIGKFLRKYSLDEFPQFFNVLKGDMSLVGPRPPLPAEVSDYNDWYGQRLSVKPGMTGMWQINGRSDLSFEEMVKLDVEYITNWSLWLDVVLLLRTIPAVINRRGAY